MHVQGWIDAFPAKALESREQGVGGVRRTWERSLQTGGNFCAPVIKITKEWGGGVSEHKGSSRKRGSDS